MVKTLLILIYHLFAIDIQYQTANMSIVAFNLPAQEKPVRNFLAWGLKADVSNDKLSFNVRYLENTLECFLYKDGDDACVWFNADGVICSVDVEEFLELLKTPQALVDYEDDDDDWE